MELHQNSISNDTGLIFTAREASNLPWVNFIVCCTKCCNFSDKIFVYNFTFNQPSCPYRSKTLQITAYLQKACQIHWQISG